MSEPMFRVGDHVSGFGLVGVVETRNESIYQDEYPLRVRWESGDVEHFTLDGKASPFHKEAALKIIERPKKKRVVKMWPALSRTQLDNKYHISSGLYESMDHAKIRGPTLFCSEVVRLITEWPPVLVEIDDE